MPAAEITGRTRVLALIADPVVQARSPAMANALLADRGRFGDFALVPLQVPAGALAEVIAGLRRVGNFAGAVVSMPHKTAVAALVDELTPEARLVGAVNVIACDGGWLRGTVLDGEGFVAGLRGAGHEVRDARCLLAGAGGAASAVAIALAAHGCRSLAIVNRTADKATALAARVRAAFPDVTITLGDAPDRRYDLAVNGTSLGMQPRDALPFPADVVDRSTLVAECVLAPEITPLLALARERKRTIHTGVPMLAAQMELMLHFMGAM